MELSLVVDCQIEAFSACRAKVMLKRDRSVVSIDDVAWLFAQFCDPHRKLSWIANGGREEDILDI